MDDKFKTLSWQSLCGYLREDHDTPIPVYGSKHCILVIKPSMGIELQMRDNNSFNTEISSLPVLTRFAYEKFETCDYCYLVIKCEIPDLIEPALDFFYSIGLNMIEGRRSAKEAIIESYEQYKALLTQPQNPQQYTLKGLWGELYSIKSVLDNPQIDPNSIILNWTGPDGQPNDFSFGNTAIEIKTTSKQINKIDISSFEQLDAERCWLIIVHAFNASIEDNGISINYLINAIREKVNAYTLEIFKSRIDRVLDSMGNPTALNYSMKSDGESVIVEMGESIPLLTRSKLNCIFGKEVSYLIEKGSYTLNLSSVEYSRKKIDAVFLEAQKLG
jgi:hypothetical protein